MSRESGTKTTKVDRVIEAYELTDLEKELERKWTATEGNNWSLRDLSDYFNQEVLRAALEQTGQQPSEWEVETTYRILTDDDISPSERMERKRNLQRQGVQVDEIVEDFVSHQTVHTYLTEHRNVTRPDEERRDRTATAKRAVNRIQSRTAAVVESNVERLQSAGELDVGDVDTLVSVEVYCNDCGVSKPFGELLKDGGCDCPNR